MTSKASKGKGHRGLQGKRVRRITNSVWWMVAIAAAAALWFVVVTGAASRLHFVVGYNVVAAGPPLLEPFFASHLAWAFATFAMAVWCGLAATLLRSQRAAVTAQAFASVAATATTTATTATTATTTPTTIPATARIRWAVGGLVLAAMPLMAANLLRLDGAELRPQYWEPLWLAGWSGLSFAWLVQGCVAIPFSSLPSWISQLSTELDTQSGTRSGPQLGGQPSHQPAAPLPVPGERGNSPLGRLGISRSLWRRWDLWATIAAASVAGVGWVWQSHSYYHNFLLGFNDFGHFVQRIANTASGRGLLLESPVMPMFWDHFNPGLLLLVPLWMLFPSVYLFFVLQALSLASGAVCVWGIARQQGLGRLPGLLFGLAWLAQPVVGQMNLAYTYGWHPISLAIPLLLAAIWSLTARRRWTALTLAVLAMSMEEGVIVIVCLFCAVYGLTNMWPLRTQPVSPPGGSGAPGGSAPVNSPQDSSRESPRESLRESLFGVSPGVWLLLAVGCGLAFVLVYRWSGLAEFQTARFARLGATTGEVLLSPVLRPAAFWGSLFRWPKLYFLLSLWLPCFISSLWRGWRPLLVTALPLLVLLVWEHRPATSLAFQYSSTLLPLFWLATIQGTHALTQRCSRARGAGCKSNPTGVAAGVAAGALSTGLILSLFVGQLVYSSTTLIDVIAASYGAVDGPHQSRLAGDDDGQWLSEQVRQIRQDGAAVLATGRVAAHMVGNRDVETVGQYLLRRPQLAELADRRLQPITHYGWIILDRREGFQQTSIQTAVVEAEARQAGFRVVVDEFDVIVMHK